jgi:integrase
MPDVRGHNEGCLTQRSNGKKYAVVSVDGRRVSKRACPHVHKASERHRDCPESKATLRELVALRERGAEALDGSRMTLGQYLGGWLDDVRPRLAPATWRKHEQHIRNHIAPALGSRPLAALTVRDVQHLIGRTELDPQTYRHHRATLRRVLADALRDGLVTRNVAALAEPPPLPHRERPILTADQARTLIEGTRDDRLHALWTLLVTTGLREAEALGLTWEDVNLGAEQPRRGHVVQPDDDAAGVRSALADPRASGGSLGDAARGSAGSVTVRHTLHRIDGEWQLREPKTPKSRRTVTLPPVTVEALRAHRTRQLEERIAAGQPTAEGLVFVRADGRPYHGSKLTTLLYPVLDRLGLPKVSVHDLRHTASTILFDAGVDLEDVAKMLGHTDSRMLRERYVHVRPERSGAVAAAMERAMTG